MIEETRDVARVNRIANDPRIFEAVAFGLPYPLDMAPVIAKPENITFVGEHGAFIFAYCAPGVYEVHAAVLPEGQGSWTRKAGTRALDAIFGDHDAKAILFPCPVTNKAAIGGALMFGAKLLCEKDGFAMHALRRPEWEAR